MHLLRLVYISDAVLPAPDEPVMPQEVLSTIHRQSNRNNAGVGLTGMLLYGSGHFLQLLEGPAGAVQETYGRISCDLRHTNVQRILCESGEERLFSQWHMGVLNLDIKRFAFSQPLTDLLAGPSNAAADLDAAHVLNLLREFSEHLRLDQQLKETLAYA